MTKTVRELCLEYQEWVGYRENVEKFLLHDFSHILAAGLIDPDHLMDYKYARSLLPHNRIAGYEAEPLASIYDFYIRNYPYNDFVQADFSLENKMQDIKEKVKIRNEENFARDLVSREENIARTGKDDITDAFGERKHRKGRIIYATRSNEIILPEIDEMLFHAQAAKEICDNFKARTGFYPSQVLTELLDMDISLFYYKHQYPDDLLENIKKRDSKGIQFSR